MCQTNESREHSQLEAQSVTSAVHLNITKFRLKQRLQKCFVALIVKTVTIDATGTDFANSHYQLCHQAYSACT